MVIFWCLTLFSVHRFELFITYVCRLQQQNTWHVSSDDIFDVDVLIQFCFLWLQILNDRRSLETKLPTYIYLP